MKRGRKGVKVLNMDSTSKKAAKKKNKPAKNSSDRQRAQDVPSQCATEEPYDLELVKTEPGCEGGPYDLEPVKIEPGLEGSPDIKVERTDEEYMSDGQEQYGATVKSEPGVEDQEKDVKVGTSVSCKKEDNRMFSCYYCSYKTALKSSLKLHVGDHIKQPRRSPRNVPHRSTAIVKRPHQTKQMRRSHSVKEYQCESCSFSTNTIRGLVNHSALCGGRPFSCSQCAYKAKTKTHLRTHMVVHSEERPFACKHCDMRFKRKFVLVSHVKMKHSVRRPFKCPHCDYSCKLSYFLEAHIRTHSDERPFKCSFCSHTAKFRRLMQIHQREVHLRERPFKCPHCTYRATRNNLVETHKANLHGRSCEIVCN